MCDAPVGEEVSSLPREGGTTLTREQNIAS